MRTNILILVPTEVHTDANELEEYIMRELEKVSGIYSCDIDRGILENVYNNLEKYDTYEKFCDAFGLRSGLRFRCEEISDKSHGYELLDKDSYYCYIVHNSRMISDEDCIDDWKNIYNHFMLKHLNDTFVVVRVHC